MLLLAAALPAAEFKAGFGRASITPKTPIAMSGYAGRSGPSEGAVHDLWAKALALQDPAGNRFVIVTLDLSTIPRNFAEEIATRVRKTHGLPADRLLLNCSHTHAGPVIRANLHALPETEGAAAQVVTEYTRGLIDTVVETIGASLRDLSAARLAVAHGRAEFGANRREPTPDGFKLGYNPKGPTDHDVPVIIVTAPNGRLRGVLFGYACHNTTLTAKNFQLSGDYAGFAQAELEIRHPGATALFLELCGGDQNPRPRGTMELARQNGQDLAAAVDRALSGRSRKLRPPLRTAMVSAELTFAPHTREMFAAKVNDPDRWRARHAKEMLAAYDAGHPLTSIPYPVQVLRFSKDLTLIALGGEVVVDFALRAKKEFGGEDTVIAGYSNDVMCYIPSVRVLKEGGYEAVDSLIYDGMPGPFDETVEDKVFAAMREAMRKAGRNLPR